MQTSVFMGRKVMTVADVCATVGVSRTTLYRMRRDVDFPKPKTVKGHQFWNPRDIQDYCDARAAQADMDDFEAAETDDIPVLT